VHQLVPVPFALLVMQVTALQKQRGHSIRRFKAITDIVKSRGLALKAIADTGVFWFLSMINTSHPTLRGSKWGMTCLSCVWLE